MLTAAVIGCGRMGAEPSERLRGVLPPGWLPVSHAESLQSVDGIRLAALVDTDASKLERHGRHYGVTQLYPDYRQMFASLRPDIVTIATRTPEKAAIVELASEYAVKGMYVEKPFANSLRQLDQGLSAIRAAGSAVGYGVTRRYHAAYRRAKTLLGQGEIGEILDVTVEFGRAQLLWSHPHAVDLLLYLTGDTRVEWVQAFLAPDSVDRTADRIVDSDPVIEHAHFVFASGVRGTITRAGGYTVRIGGTAGMMTIHGDGAQIQISKTRGAQQGYYLDHTFHDTAPGVSATVTAFGELRDRALGAAAASISVQEIEVGLQMLFGCVWSHVERGALVRLHDVPRDLVVTGKFRGAFA